MIDTINKSTSRADIVILTAVYNDWASLKKLLTELDEVLAERGLNVRIVVVDDGSPNFADQYDFSYTILSTISAVNLITMTRNLGRMS